MELDSYVLITGASSGIGQHIAINLSDKYNLILNGRNEVALSEVISKCANPGNHIKWVYDLENIDNVEESLHAFLAHHQKTVSIFIHCAGFLKMLPLKSISKAHLLQTMNVNFNAAALLIKSLISKKINGVALQNVVFISSTASIMGAKAFNIYSASKAAADALMRSLAIELAPQVRLNSVLPGAVHTKMTDDMFNDAGLLERMTKQYPLGLGNANDVYEMVKFLISDQSRWITGQQFVVDGGRSVNISA